MVVAYHRPTKAIVDLKAISDNVANEIKRLTPDTALFAVVKANGYGHGAVQAAYAAKRGGATGFCVAMLDEGIELREAGLTEPILVLSMIPIETLGLAVEYQLAITAGTLEWLQRADEWLNNNAVKQSLTIHLKADTGMGRIGFTSVKDLLDAVKFVSDTTTMTWEGVYTHYATADQADTEYFDRQYARFAEMIDNLPAKPKYIHDSNSATALWHESKLGNMIRYGVSMYGLNPSGKALAESYHLKPALSLVSELIQVKEMPAGEGIGYGETYVTPAKQWIGTVPVGYADGWTREMQGFSVLVNDEFCEIVGRICMDQFMIKLPKEFPVGSKVTLIGKDHLQEITMQSVAEQIHTIHYEVACLISARVPREYKE